MVTNKNEKIDTQTTEGNGANSTNPQFITVDGMKLCKGLQTAFWGVALVFASLHLEIPAESMATAARNAGESVKVGADGNTAGTTAAEDAEVTEATPVEAKVEKPAKAVKKAKAEPAEAEPQETTDAPATSTAPAISIDDITKIIVQKIKKDRNNNEKIGAILKTYGIAKVSDLPAGKYEAFLTDLSAV